MKGVQVYGKKAEAPCRDIASQTQESKQNCCCAQGFVLPSVMSSGEAQDNEVFIAFIMYYKDIASTSLLLRIPINQKSMVPLTNSINILTLSL